jgi:hypothetical protein
MDVPSDPRNEAYVKFLLHQLSTEREKRKAVEREWRVTRSDMSRSLPSSSSGVPSASLGYRSPPVPPTPSSPPPIPGTVAAAALSDRMSTQERLRMLEQRLREGLNRFSTAAARKSPVRRSPSPSRRSPDPARSVAYATSPPARTALPVPLPPTRPLSDVGVDPVFPSHAAAPRHAAPPHSAISAAAAAAAAAGAAAAAASYSVAAGGVSEQTGHDGMNRYVVGAPRVSPSRRSPSPARAPPHPVFPAPAAVPRHAAPPHTARSGVAAGSTSELDAALTDEARGVLQWAAREEARLDALQDTLRRVRSLAAGSVADAALPVRALSPQRAFSPQQTPAPQRPIVAESVVHEASAGAVMLRRVSPSKVCVLRLPACVDLV